MNLPSLIGGLAGALTLTALNQTVKKFDGQAPRLDLLGMNAAAKLLKGAGLKSVATHGKLMPMALTGDLISNSLYFGMADTGSNKGTMARGTLLGIAAGIGALTLAKPLGLDGRISEVPAKTKAMTVAWYVAGGLIAAAVINLVSRRSSLQNGAQSHAR